MATLLEPSTIQPSPYDPLRARQTCMENTFSPRTVSGVRTASVQEGPDNPSDNIGYSVHAYGHLTPSIDGVGADYVDTADPLAFHTYPIPNPTGNASEWPRKRRGQVPPPRQ